MAKIKPHLRPKEDVDLLVHKMQTKEELIATLKKLQEVRIYTRQEWQKPIADVFEAITLAFPGCNFNLTFSLNSYSLVFKGRLSKKLFTVHTRALSATVEGVELGIRSAGEAHSPEELWDILCTYLNLECVKAFLLQCRADEEAQSR